MKTDGVNQGRVGGGCCGARAGTLRGGKAQGCLAQKVANCMECGCCKLVKNEKGANDAGTKELLKKLA